MANSGILKVAAAAASPPCRERTTPRSRTCLRWRLERNLLPGEREVAVAATEGMAEEKGTGIGRGGGAGREREGETEMEEGEGERGRDRGREGGKETGCPGREGEGEAEETGGGATGPGAGRATGRGREKGVSATGKDLALGHKGSVGRLCQARG